ncbi:MAG TPA: DUF559 domain-containing protein [Polyangiaceae bacterium]|nr:DUF559 domain-containing protein [Polyangiaceae bacterium]
MRNHRFPNSSHREAVLTERAREMRHQPTSSEQVVWQAIRGCRLGVQFRRQVALGRYIADFFASEVGLVVEVDGGYHQRLRARADERRDRWLQRRGYTVLRVQESLVLRDLSAVLSVIRQHITARRE